MVPKAEETTPTVALTRALLLQRGGGYLSMSDEGACLHRVHPLGDCTRRHPISPCGNKGPASLVGRELHRESAFAAVRAVQTLGISGDPEGRIVFWVS